MTSSLAAVDHLVFAALDLEAGIDRLEQITGVRASPGGSHPGRGTRNALMSLDERSYLEIIGPDPEQGSPSAPRPFGIDKLERPRLVAWAVAAPGIDECVAAARRRGYEAGTVISMSRELPDGSHLSWRLTLPPTGEASDDEARIVPFLIDWCDAPHPSSTSAAGCRLDALCAAHPRPDSLSTALVGLGLEIEVARGDAARLEATLDTPNGRIVLS